MKNPTKILFISRAYPPVTGGIENQNYELSVWLPKISQTQTVANRHGKKFLPFFLPYVLLKAIFISKKYDGILLGDGVLAIIGWILKVLCKKPIVLIVHGLDLTYKNSFYQKIWVNFFIPKLDKLIAVGNETVRVAVEKGIAPEKIVFIPNGVDTEKFIGTYTQTDLEKIIGEKIGDKKTILSTGRLAIHKGIDWFTENVVPRLKEDIIFIIAGDGEKRETIKKLIQGKRLEKNVKMLGKVSDTDLKVLYNTADIYVKPNIKISGTMEGFGLVAIEAASCKLPVIASNLEGLKDAIKDGQNGFLVETCDANGFVKKIEELLSDDEFRKNFGEKARQFVIENYSWEKISKKYLEEIEKTISK